QPLLHLGLNERADVCVDPRSPVLVGEPQERPHDRPPAHRTPDIVRCILTEALERRNRLGRQVEGPQVPRGLFTGGGRSRSRPRQKNINPRTARGERGGGGGDLKAAPRSGERESFLLGIAAL